MLASVPLHDLHEAYAMVHREAQRQVTMTAEGSTEASALVAKEAQPHPVPDSSPKSIFSGCTYCKSRKHVRENCWKVVGYPEWFKLKQAARKDKQKSKEYLVSSDSPKTATASQVSCPSTITGNIGCVFSSTYTQPWIFDSGASDHMTSDSSRFVTFTPPHHSSVKVAKGVLTSIQGAGSLSLTPSMSLSSVLYVPSLSNNLLYVRQITKQLNCSVTFFPTYCVFHDLLTKMTIGIGKERSDLDYFEETDSAGRVFQVDGDPTSKPEKIMLWHRRLAYPSFLYLEHLFPSLFTKVWSSSFTVLILHFG